MVGHQFSRWGELVGAVVKDGARQISGEVVKEVLSTGTTWVVTCQVCTCVCVNMVCRVVWVPSEPPRKEKGRDMAGRAWLDTSSPGVVRPHKCWAYTSSVLGYVAEVGRNGFSRQGLQWSGGVMIGHW